MPPREYPAKPPVTTQGTHFDRAGAERLAGNPEGTKGTISCVMGMTIPAKISKLLILLNLNGAIMDIMLNVRVNCS